MVHIARLDDRWRHTYTACLREERGPCLKKSVIDRIPIAMWRIVWNRRSAVVNKRRIHGFKAEECMFAAIRTRCSGCFNSRFYEILV